MRSQYDIAAYSSADELILIGEVKALKEPAESGALVFRRNLVTHGLLPVEPFFLLVYKTAVYLWSPNSSADSGPAYRASAKPILTRILGEAAEQDALIGPERLEFAVKTWLSELVHGLREPDPHSEADKVLIDSGVYSKIRGGEVRRDFTP